VICRIHAPLASKKEHPVLAEGWRGTRGDTDALQLKTHIVSAENTTSISRLPRPELSGIQYPIDTELKRNVTFLLIFETTTSRPRV